MDAERIAERIAKELVSEKDIARRIAKKLMAGELSPVEAGRQREEIIIDGLQKLAKKFGFKMMHIPNQSHRIDSRGNISFYIKQPSSDETMRFPAPLVSLFKSMGGKFKYVHEMSNGVEANHFEWEKLLLKSRINKKELENIEKQRLAKSLISRVNEREVLQGYLITALWSSNDDNDENYNIRDIASASVSDAKRDIKKFLQHAGDLVEVDDNDESRIGHDFWLNRNGHGAGFWDGDYPKAGKELDKMATRFGENTVYVGDDGKIYID